jgi:hypothetical protein
MIVRSLYLRMICEATCGGADSRSSNVGRSNPGRITRKRRPGKYSSMPPAGRVSGHAAGMSPGNLISTNVASSFRDGFVLMRRINAPPAGTAPSCNRRRQA